VNRVVVTGIGVVAPGGNDVTTFWEVLTAGRTQTKQISLFDASPFRSQTAAECSFDPIAAGLTPREARRMDRATQMAVVSMRQAVNDAGLERSDDLAARCGVSIGNAVGCTTSLEREYAVTSDSGRLWEVDLEYAVPELYTHFVPSSIAVEIARDFGAEGPVSVISTGCTSGIDSVGNAFELIAAGHADVVLAGAAEAPISPITSACFDAILATSPRNDTPESACRPFDATRSGLVLGEGAASLILEDYEHAVSRGAHIYAEVRGFASRCNAFHMTGLSPDGTEMSDAIDAALRQGDVESNEIDYINAHGSGTKMNDRHETGAFKKSLGDHAYNVPISSIKAIVGHSLGAIGSIELVACILAMANNVVPPTANLTTPDPDCDLDYVPLAARSHDTKTVLSVGSGFGGFQSAIVLSRKGL
jgi:act minimal PKS ketosynthase (KS/KS alpha)